MEGLPFLAGGGVNLTGLQIVDITQIFPFRNTKYHKSCYKAFTSMQNLSTCSNFKSTRPTSASCNQNPSSREDNFTIVTRSRASEIDWTACILQTQSLCVSASLLGWWKQIDRMHFHALTSEVPRSLF
jgi:hypothetical protein